MQRYKKLIIASNNAAKVAEIKSILKDFAREIYSLSEVGIDIEIQEDGTTFEENALIKARTIFELVGCPVIADDSGLEVNALRGAPGVHSARFAGEPCNDEKNNQLLLDSLQGKLDRNARFVSAVVLYEQKGSYISAKGECKGEIMHNFMGKGGFGYDPLFFSSELNKTFGQASSKEKNRVSHRGRALGKLVEKLSQKGKI